MKTSLCVLTLLWAFAAPVQAGMISVDEILFQGDASNGNILTGTVDMSLSGNTLTILLTNTSTSLAFEGNGANNLLTGLGFNLPTGVTILSGTATVPGGVTNIGFDVLATNVGGEWGYANSPIASGHFDGSPSTLGYSTVISADTADVQSLFGGLDLGAPNNGIDGPDFGLLSASLANTAAGGNEAIQNTLTIVLTLGGTLPNDLLSQIEAKPVALAFASPDQTVLESSEPAAVALFGIGSLGLVWFTRRRRT